MAKDSCWNVFTDSDAGTDDSYGLHFFEATERVYGVRTTQRQKKMTIQQRLKQQQFFRLLKRIIEDAEREIKYLEALEYGAFDYYEWQ